MAAQLLPQIANLRGASSRGKDSDETMKLAILLNYMLRQAEMGRKPEAAAKEHEYAMQELTKRGELTGEWQRDVARIQKQATVDREKVISAHKELLARRKDTVQMGKEMLPILYQLALEKTGGVLSPNVTEAMLGDVAAAAEAQKVGEEDLAKGLISELYGKSQMDAVTKEITVTEADILSVLHKYREDTKNAVEQMGTIEDRGTLMARHVARALADGHVYDYREWAHRRQTQMSMAHDQMVSDINYRQEGTLANVGETLAETGELMVQGTKDVGQALWDSARQTFVGAPQVTERPGIKKAPVQSFGQWKARISEALHRSKSPMVGGENPVLKGASREMVINSLARSGWIRERAIALGSEKDPNWAAAGEPPGSEGALTPKDWAALSKDKPGQVQLAYSILDHVKTTTTVAGAGGPDGKDGTDVERANWELVSQGVSRATDYLAHTPPAQRLKHATTSNELMEGVMQPGPEDGEGMFNREALARVLNRLNHGGIKGMEDMRESMKKQGLPMYILDPWLEGVMPRIKALQELKLSEDTRRAISEIQSDTLANLGLKIQKARNEVRGPIMAAQVDYMGSLLQYSSGGTPEALNRAIKTYENGLKSLPEFEGVEEAKKQMLNQIEEARKKLADQATEKSKTQISETREQAYRAGLEYWMNRDMKNTNRPVTVPGSGNLPKNPVIKVPVLPQVNIPPPAAPAKPEPQPGAAPGGMTAPGASQQPGSTPGPTWSANAKANQKVMGNQNGGMGTGWTAGAGGGF